PVHLVGKRAELVPLEVAHIPDLYTTGNNPEIWHHLPMTVNTLDDMSDVVYAFLEDQQKGRSLPFTIIDQESNRVVGSTRFHNISHENWSIEIGKTWLSPTVWGTHLNTECKYLLMRHCFETLHTIRVQLKTDVRNIRSQRAIERIGGVRDGVLRNHWIQPDGYKRSSVYYSILLEEWPERKKMLENMIY
ncbi:MAG: GNAT family N-acetyltransferase, partial [Ktedonobacteraceae bacterium]